jgi:beta-mannosidase
VRLLENGKHVGSRNAFALPIKDLELPPPAPVFHKKSVMDGVEVTVESPVFLKNLRLETDSEGFWEDNFFDVLPGVAKTVLFRSAHPGVLDLRWQVVTN